MGALGDLARTTFVGGPGTVLAQLMLISVVAYVGGYIAQASGKAQLAGLIHVVSTFLGISMAIGTIISALANFARILGLIN